MNSRTNYANKVLLFFLAAGMAAGSFSCKSSKLKKDDGHYILSTTVKNGNDEEVKTEVNVMPNIVDSLKLSDTRLDLMESYAVSAAMDKLKYPRTFKCSKKGGMIYKMDADSAHPKGYLVVSVDGVAANGFGVESDYHKYIDFDLEGNQIKDKE